jgi:proteasome beta subunit
MTSSNPVRGPLRLGEQVADGSFLSVLDARGMSPKWETGNIQTQQIPEATTVIALRWADGVLMAGDRRATAGNVIAHSRMRKVYPADEHSAIAISGTAGMAIELIRLFQTELEHYEKIEGTHLSLEGKANYLARMVRGNLSLAFQGLVVIPLFCGYDIEGHTARLFSFDVVGGRYDELNYATTGSGGMEAKSFLKSAWRDDLSEDEALTIAIESLVAAAEEDSATGGPDVKRGIYPTVIAVTADGVVEFDDDALSTSTARVLENRP